MKEISKSELQQEYKIVWRLWMFKQTVADVLKMLGNLFGNRGKDYEDLARR